MLLLGAEIVIIGGIIGGIIALRIGLNKIIRECTAPPEEIIVMPSSYIPIMIGRVIKSTRFVGNCVICFDPMETGNLLRELECGHIYHQQCADQWLRIAANCPVCRSGV